MEDRVARLEARVEALAAALARVEARLAVIDGETVRAEPTAAAAPSPAEPVSEPFFSGVVPIIGRTFVLLGGAWLLRALTEAGTLPGLAGVMVGLAYAIAVLVAADRAAARRRMTSAEVLGLTGSIVAFPLIFESVTRLSALTAPAACAVLAALFAFGLTVAWRRGLRGTAWAVTVGTLVTAVALIVSARCIESCTLVLVGVGVATVWLSYERHWFALRWIAAAVADLFVLVMVDLASRPDGPPDVWHALSAPLAQAIAVALLVSYLATFAVRTLVRSRNVNVFEVVQTLAALGVGLGGAAAVARAAGVGRTALGWAALIAAAACYAVAFAFLDRRLDTQVNLIFYTSLGLVLTLSGTALVAAGPVRVVAWCGLALVAAVLGGRWNRNTLRAQCVVYVAAAAIAAGTAAITHRAFLGALAPSEPGPSAGQWLVLVAALVAYSALVATSRVPNGGWVKRLPHVAAAAVALAALGGVVVVLTWRAVSGGGGGADEAVLATIRTGVLAVAAVVLAFVGRRVDAQELGWLATAVLALGGVKLLLQDLPHGRPATLVLGFVLYGVALIVAPRLMRRERVIPS